LIKAINLGAYLALSMNWTKKNKKRRWVVKFLTTILGLAVAAAIALQPVPVRAEATTLRMSHGYSILYLPLIIMRDQKFIEEQAEKRGLGKIDVQWKVIDGGNVINDAILSGAIDMAGTGTPGLLALWDKGQGNIRTEVVGVSGMGSTAMWLNSNRPDVKSLKDFTDKDKIALPGIKTSLAAGILEMAVAKQFGVENYDKLDPLTVGLSQPDSYTALVSGHGGITAHFTSPPFSYLEVASPNVHKVLSSVDVLGNISLSIIFGSKKFTDDNPKLTAAVVAALDEANDFIAKHKDQAAEIYIKSAAATTKKEELVQILNDPDTRFSSTPTGIMMFADFMARAGTMKHKLTSWKDAFVPAVWNLPGS
jgi:NitT/TauT family transport system substrate-binding protein